MIKVLHSIDTTGPGGAETVFLTLITGLNRGIYTAFPVITGKGWLYDELVKSGFQPLFVNSRGSFSVRYLYQLIQIIKRYDINIIQSHLFGSNVYCSLCGLICRIPVISTFHGYVDASRNDNFLKLKCKVINRGSAKIVFVSDHLKEAFLTTTNLSSKKAVTVYNGIDTVLFRPRNDNSIRKLLGLREENILVGSIGNIRKAKGYDILLRAARLTVERHPQCRFVIVGEGAGNLYDDIIALRRRLNIEDIVFLLGFRENISDILNNLDVFLLTSRTEGFSISTVEAMASGIPVVVTKSGGPEEIVINGQNGITVEPGDESQIAMAISRFIEDNELRHKCTENAKRTVLSKFDLRVMLKNYEALYDKVL